MAANTGDSQAMNEDLKTLVQELSKTNPDAELIKTKTGLLGIPYSADLIIMMSEVLVYLSKLNVPSRGRLKVNPA